MLDSSKIKEFILHPDVHLSNAAIEYFNDSFSEDTEVLNLALGRYPSLSDTERIHLLLNTENLKLNMEAINKILLYLPDASHKLKLKLERILCNAEASLIKQAKLNKLKLYPNTKSIIDNKLRFSSMPTEDLIDELFDFSVKNTLKYMNEFDYGYGNLIVKELAAREDLDDTSIVKQLTETDIEEFTYYECYLLTLCGMRKSTSLIPVFVNGLSSSDFISEESMFALTRIGTKEVVDIIENRYLEDTDDFKIFAGGTLEDIKLPESEKAAIKLLKQETDVTLKTLMAGALCRLNSSEAISEISKLIEEGYDDSILNLEEYAYINCIFNGLDIPEMAAWKKSYEEERAFYLNSLKPTISFALKLGRNDPCTCGSGLKYKKCCGANK